MSARKKKKRNFWRFNERYTRSFFEIFFFQGFHDESFVTLTFLSSEKDEETCVGYCTQSDSKEGPDILLILEKNGAHMEEIQNQA